MTELGSKQLYFTYGMFTSISLKYAPKHIDTSNIRVQISESCHWTLFEFIENWFELTI